MPELYFVYEGSFPLLPPSDHIKEMTKATEVIDDRHGYRTVVVPHYNASNAIHWMEKRGFTYLQ